MTARLGAVGVPVAACLLALAASRAAALPVTEGTARLVARNAIREHLATFGIWGGAANPQVESVDPVAVGPNALAFNVRVRPSGHVLVAADDELAAVLLYSDTRAFEPARAAEAGSIESWLVPHLGDLAARVRDEARKRAPGTRPAGWAVSFVGLEWQHFDVPEASFRPTRRSRRQEGPAAPGASPQLAAAGAAAQSGPAPQGATLVGPLLATEWNQGSAYGMYYNNLAPAGPTCAHTYAGCVAIAVAQLMKYWNWPPSGVGATHYVRGVPARAFDADLTHAYDWALMPPVLDGNSTLPQINAVARLVVDVGYAADMDWDCASSTSFTSFAAITALPAHFGYWPTTGQIDHSVVGAAAFFAAVQADLDAVPPRPVLMALSGTPGGHAIVVDGYQTGTSNLAHVNMGWGPSYQGWYNIFDPATWYNGGTWTVSTEQIFPGIRPHAPAYTLSVSRAGAGAGFVASAPAGIACERTCWWPFDPSATVTLAATPGAGSHFAGWRGDCDAGGAVVMSSNRACEARFDLDDPASLPAAVGNAGLSFTVGGPAGWFSQPTTTRSGGTAAQSGAIGDNQASWMETTVAGPTTLSFDWTVSSEYEWDYLSVYLDGALYGTSISGSAGWSPVAIPIPVGLHTVRWEYSKDTTTSVGGDAGWVDDIALSPVPSGAAPVTALLQPGAALAGGPGFTLAVSGTGFDSTSTVLWNGSARPTTFVSSTRVQASIAAGDIATAGHARVSAYTPGGWVSNARPFTVYGPYTDEPLQAGSTPVKAAHINELRQRVDDLRLRFGLAGYAWMDASVLPSVTTVRAAHLEELRAALLEAYQAAGAAPPDLGAAILARQTVIAAAQIAALRAAVVALW